MCARMVSSAMLVEQFGIDRVDAVVGDDGQVVGHAQVLEVVLGIDLDGVVGLHEGVADGVFDAATNPGFRCDVGHWFQYSRFDAAFQ